MIPPNVSSFILCMRVFQVGRLSICMRWKVNPFPTYDKSAADDFENIPTNIKKRFFKRKYNYKIVLKTLWQMEKLLIMSNFSIYRNVSRSRLLQCQKAYICGKWLNYELYRSCRRGAGNARKTFQTCSSLPPGL